MKINVIKELKITDQDILFGVNAISFVSIPAVEDSILEYFTDNGISVAFKEGKLPFFRYTANPDPETISTSHEFCRAHAGKVYHISEIRAFQKNYEWINDSSFFANFNDSGDYSCDNQIHNCRHYLVRVSSINEVPRNKWHMLSAEIPNLPKADEIFFEFSEQNDEKHEVKGIALVSGKLIYRNNADGKGNSGYVYFSRQTVRILAQRFGKSNNVTLQHDKDITGACTLLSSEVIEDDVKNESVWLLHYKVADEGLWNQIKKHEVTGLSIEAVFPLG